MEKKKNIIARHKLLFLICLLAFIITVVLFYIFFSLFIGGNDPYGNRLKGVSSVKITSEHKKEIKTFLEEKEEVKSASIRVQGKIIYVHITTNNGVSLEKAKAIAAETIDKFSDKEKKMYDIGYFLKEDKEDGYIVTGSKSTASPSVVWIKS